MQIDYSWHDIVPSDFHHYCRQMFTLSPQPSGHPRHSRSEEVALLHDIGHFASRLEGERQEEEAVRERAEANHELLRRIGEYNRSNRNGKDKERERRNRGKESGEERRRKVRTTITQEKLEEMNRIFYDYYEKERAGTEQREWIPSGGSEVRSSTSLKEIGERLGLGYSTILHKFREYKATQRVKGGALIKAKENKRKYKKSKEIEEMIQESLRSEQKFYTAVELAQYIKKKYDKTLSRSIISRHLGEMGYSYKNVKSRVSDPNSQEIRELRRMFAQVLIGLRSEGQRVYFVDEVGVEEDGVFAMVLASYERVLCFKVQAEPVGEEQYFRWIEQCETLVAQDGPHKGVMVVTLNDKARNLARVTASRARLESVNCRLFFTPPFSRPLSLLEHVAEQIRQRCQQAEEMASSEQLCGVVEDCLGGLGRERMAELAEDCEGYLTRAVQMEEFIVE